MAKGENHLKIWKRLIPFSVFISLVLMFFSPSIGIMCLFGYLIGEPILSPDLDHRSMTSQEYRMMKKFGLFGALWVGYWQPYGYMFKHRSFWSHFPFVSDLIRIVYLLLLPGLAAIYYRIAIHNTVLHMIAGTIIGLSISTTVHYILDWKKK